jgi:hypothetical protein
MRVKRALPDARAGRSVQSSLSPAARRAPARVGALRAGAGQPPRAFEQRAQANGLTGRNASRHTRVAVTRPIRVGIVGLGRIFDQRKRMIEFLQGMIEELEQQKDEPVLTAAEEKRVSAPKRVPRMRGVATEVEDRTGDRRVPAARNGRRRAA